MCDFTWHLKHWKALKHFTEISFSITLWLRTYSFRRRGLSDRQPQNQQEVGKAQEKQGSKTWAAQSLFLVKQPLERELSSGSVNWVSL